MELPHTTGCLVCGRENPHGLKLSLHVDDAGIVTVDFTPAPHHIGFTGVTHGGVLASVLDEAMVWAATWAGKRFCLCAEMTVRFRQPSRVGQKLRVEARVDMHRTRMILTRGKALAEDGSVVVEASGKYMPLSAEENRAFVATLVDEAGTTETARQLKAGAVSSA